MRTLSGDEDEGSVGGEGKEAEKGDIELKNYEGGDEAGEDIGADEDNEVDKRGEFIGNLLKQYYFIHNYLNLYSLLYLVLKFDLFTGQTLIIAKDSDNMYKLKIFLERAGFTKVQTYNVEAPLNIRAHHLALFTSKKLNLLVSTPEFYKDIKKNKSKLLWPKSVKNVIIFNAKIGFHDYSNLLELIKGAQDFMNMKNMEIDNNV